MKDFMRTDTGVIVNSNVDEYTRYMMQRKNIDKINTLEGEILELKTDISDIKDLLKNLVSSLNQS